MKGSLLVVALATLVVGARPAEAFCGFYVAGSDKPMFNEATQVVLMRSGTRTVLSMRNAYKGPVDQFAMVIPVPTVLHDGDVKTLNPEVFDIVDKLGSPRLVEYWEQDPCGKPDDGEEESGGTGTAMALDEGKMGKKDVETGVTIEATFKVGEYDIVILSATESTGLETWLRREKYAIPANVAPLLRPYVEGGLKFFVAKVDPTKVAFVDGRAMLSPLRFHYDSEQFVLPIRLGLANSAGMQDLIVNIIAPKRHEVANFNNVFIPTNINVKNAVRERFGGFYVSLFDETIKKTPNAVVTEYAWSTSGCDPCPVPGLDATLLDALGNDVIGGDALGFTLTRLHARYDKTVADDLWFRETTGIRGGGEGDTDERGKLSQGAAQSQINRFQARYIIRHRWKGPVACDNPVRDVWGGPPSEEAANDRPRPAQNLAFAPRSLQLASAVAQAIPELGIKPQNGALKNLPAAATQTTKSSKGGCGCDGGGGAGALIVVTWPLAGLRRRRSARA